MMQGFDIAATDYDITFTHTQIGGMQRNLVYSHVEKLLSLSENQHILEINCGTGEDAIWLTGKGHNVFATDISSEMIRTANAKTEEGIVNPHFEQMDINELGKQHFDTPFDLIFSNFGGLNCLSPDQLKLFFKNAFLHLKPGGHIIAVIMPKHCLLETVYFLFKGSTKKAFRRNTQQSVDANVDGVKIPTWYYNPNDIIEMTDGIFENIDLYPIGFFIPPSYLELFFKNKKRLLHLFKKVDGLFQKKQWISKYSDHYFISLKKQ